jgi:hypothetical protein
MIVVIQCAASKDPRAGHLKTASGMPVMFVANPNAAPPRPELAYARPDDMSDTGISWSQVLLKYNSNPENNAWGLYPAYRLYKNAAYERLTKRFGMQNIFILSAGWGLISASFLTPMYDITFSMSAEAYKRRGRRDRYADLCTLPGDADDIAFVGGKDYLPLFCTLTRALGGRKTVFYNSRNAPDAPGCRLQRFETTTRTNWHYECANALIEGTIGHSASR